MSRSTGKGTMATTGTRTDASTPPRGPVAALRAVLALLVLLALLVGIPVVVLGAVGALDIPHLPQLDTGALSWHTLTQHDVGTTATNDLLIAGALLVATVCWALFAVASTAEFAAAVRGMPVLRLPFGLSLMQGIAGPLVAAVVLVFLSGARPALATPSNPARALPRAVAVTAPRSVPATGTTAAATARRAHPESLRADAAVGSALGTGVGPVCTVARGDTLMRLAEVHLGDGMRWKEIWNLNRGHAQADGSVLTDPNVLRTGWVLLLPLGAHTTDTGPAAAPSIPANATAQVTPPNTAASAPGGTAPPQETVTVHPGETLWDLEQKVTGSGGNWREGWAANADRAEPNGQHYDNVDLIRPGWTLDIPLAGADTAPAQPHKPTSPPHAVTDDHLPAPVSRTVDPLAPNTPAVSVPAPTRNQTETTPQGGVSAPPAVPKPALPTSLAPSAAEGVTPPAAGHAQTISPVPGAQATDEQRDVDLIAFSGGGLLLAGLVLGALKVHRRRQFRLRRPGRLIGVTSPALLGTEASVLSAGKIGLPDVTWLDHALRGLVQRLAEIEDPALPDVVAVRLTEHVVELVLAVPAAGAPAPWTAEENGQRWVLQRGQHAGYDEEHRSQFFAPFPALVSVGYTEDGDHWLIDLERVGALALQGDPERCLDLARYLAAELAHNTWSEMLSVTTVAFGEELAPIGDRLTYSPDADRAVLTAQRRHHSVVSAISKIGVDVLTGRFRNISTDAWASHVLLVAPNAADAKAVERLLAAMRENGTRAAVAVVLAGGSSEHSGARWQLTVDAEGALTVPALGVRLTAQQLPVEEGRHLAQLLSEAAHAPDRSVPPAAPGENPCDAWYADALGALRAGLVTQAPPTLTLVPAQPTGWGLRAPDAQDVDATTIAGGSPHPMLVEDTGRDIDHDEAIAGVASETGGHPGPATRNAEPGQHLSEPDVAAASTAAVLEPANAEPGTTPDGGAAEETPPSLPAADACVGLLVPAQLRTAVVDNDPNLEADLAEWWGAAVTRPKVTLLGPLRVRARGSLPVDRPRESFHTEVVAYLVTQQQQTGVRHQTVDMDLFPGLRSDSGKSPPRVRNAMSKVRLWLGADDDGKEFLPKVADDEGYRIVGALVDEQLFRRLRLRSQVLQGAERIALLHRALDLVSGAPFDCRREEGYEWLAGKSLESAALSMIADVAHEVADYYLPDDPRLPADPLRALEAADVALRAGSTADTPLLDKMRACFRLGRIAEAEDYVRRVVNNNPNGDEEEDLPKATYDVLLSYRALS